MRRSSLLIIFLIVFFDLVGFGIVIPILPYYAREMGASAWELGWLMASYSLMQFLFAPVWGRLSDRIGRRPVLLTSVMGSSLSMLMLGFAPTLRWVFIARILAGTCGANISTAYAYVADVTTEKDRAKGMGMIGAGFGLGFIFGPAIGGILSKYGLSAPMFAGSGLALFNFIFAYFKLGEPNAARETRAANRTKRFDLQAWSIALGNSQTRIAILAFFLVTLAVTQMETVFAIYMLGRFHYDAQAAGILLAIMGIVMVGVQGGLIGKLSRRFGEVRLILCGTLLCAIALSGFALASTIPPLVAALCLMALGHGVLHPSLSSLTSLGTSPEGKGATMGVFHSMSSLARVIGPPIAGILYDRLSPGSPFYSGSITLLLALGLVGMWSANPQAAREGSLST